MVSYLNNTTLEADTAAMGVESIAGLIYNKTSFVRFLLYLVSPKEASYATVEEVPNYFLRVNPTNTVKSQHYWPNLNLYFAR